jgi:hypothetical protein
MMDNRQKIITLLFAGLTIVTGIALGVMAGHDPNRVSSDSTIAHKTTSQLKAKSEKLQTPPVISNTAPSPRVTVNTSGNCTKSVTSDKQQTANGETETSKTAVHCSNQGQGSTTNVSVSSRSQQTSSSGSSSSGQSGSAANSDSTNVDIN